MQRLKLFLPLLVFVVLAALFFSVLEDKDYDPQALPSALLGKPMPAFQLPALLQQRTLSEADLTGEVALLNVWATWCVTCRVEHPYLLKLAREQGLAIYGVSYKDDSDSAREWLQNLGNPYRFNIVDAEGKLGLDLGVYGAPESYLLDQQGVIRYKRVGVVDENIWQHDIKPLVEQLRRQAPGTASGGKS